MAQTLRIILACRIGGMRHGWNQWEQKDQEATGRRNPFEEIVSQQEADEEARKNKPIRHMRTKVESKGRIQ